MFGPCSCSWPYLSAATSFVNLLPGPCRWSHLPTSACGLPAATSFVGVAAEDPVGGPIPCITQPTTCLWPACRHQPCAFCYQDPAIGPVSCLPSSAHPAYNPRSLRMSRRAGNLPYPPVACHVPPAYAAIQQLGPCCRSLARPQPILHCD